ncbi:MULTISPECIES: DJ-1/PfpI family protein [Streptomycetaceae]|uniref:ThiJ/PfpI domain-containing protein n=1 Tax=Streptantibioticus cattleyicolor (strain ATCC 35852 / DSM 46488 / JCM 4925 / NBRC 14057 / NRRL 8057) TaxID=1003195 RepID=F8K2X5_STREN|nr:MULTISPECIES: DJ-1/PfpI family protein [Streptomycetaceae]AEW92460.1 ThiJ/PfpI domain-containing protein [Streptantibioticus cattleyicolor NRRL 8057 = DSM 46488]MYS57267.1 thiamine biosynthesis protein ThiJ [Streptomyces sp. SID5468]CCB72824.1 ThiJ/PfpI domain containing protein [Streptantibioticus cattleyicolor NRRL 8057 = DSM 46488]
MGTVKPLKTGRLAGKRVGVLMESDFVEDEIDYYLRRFAEEGAEVRLLTRLWGQPRLTFTGHEHRRAVEVDGDLEALDYHELLQYSALVVPGGMVADRLRYSEDVDQASPALELLRRAFRIPNLVKAFCCHGLLLVSAAPELVRERPVACHNNLAADVRNMGAVYLNQDVVVDRDLVTVRTADHCHLLARTVIERLAELRKAAA